MSEPFLERLTRFTPDASGLDRDALLFAAGRSSARPNRGWMAIASALAGTQVLSLVFLWPHGAPNPSDGRLTDAIATNSPAPPATEPRASDALASPGPWSTRRSLREPESEYRPPYDVTLIESGPPLRASGSIPQSLLN